MSTNKELFLEQLNALAEAINRKAGTEGKKSIPELTEIVNNLLNRAPTGVINITNTNLTDVADFAFAQVSDPDLVPYNIAKNVNILGVTGTLDAPEGNIDITSAGYTDVREYATARVVDNDIRPENIKQGVNILGTIGLLIPKARPIITDASQEISRQGQSGYVHLIQSQYDELVALGEGEFVAFDLSWLPYEDSSGYFGSNIVAIRLDPSNPEYDATFIASDFSSNSTQAEDFKARIFVINLLGFSHVFNYNYIVCSSSSDATADASEILEGSTAYVNNKKITGTMPTKAAETFYPSVENQIITSGQYLNGDQVIQGVQVTNLVAENIAKGVVVGVGDAINPARITNVVGTYESYPVINLSTSEPTGIFNKTFIITPAQYQILADLANQDVAKFTWPDIEDEQPVILTHFATKTGSDQYQILGWEAQWFVISESYSWDPQGATIQGLAAVHNLTNDTYIVGFFTEANLIDTANGTATADDLLAGKTAYSQGQIIVGTIPSFGAQSYEPSTSVQTISGGQYLTGPQTLRPVTTNLTADKILKGQTVNIGSPVNPTSILSLIGTAESYPEINVTYRSTSSSYATFNIAATDVLALYNASRDALVKLNFDQAVPAIGLNQTSLFITKMWNKDDWFFDSFEEYDKDSHWIAVESLPDTSSESPQYYLTDIRGINIGLFLEQPYLEVYTNKKAVDTSSANATAGEILKNKTAFVNGQKITGTMESAKAEETQEIVLSFGTGSGSIIVTPTDDQHTISRVDILKPSTLQASNIKDGVEIAGITGNFTHLTAGFATVSDVLSGKHFFVNGTQYQGQILSLSDTTYYPDVNTAKVIINPRKFIIGNQRLPGLTFTNLVASNIAAGVTVKVGDTDRGDSSYLSIAGTAELRKPESSPEIILNLATGNQVVEPGDNSVYSSVTILKPQDLDENNIVVGKKIAGITGIFSSDGTAAETDIARNKVAYVNGQRIVGTFDGFVPSGKITITNTAEVNVANYATAQVVDDNLNPSNIADGVTILGITGSYDNRKPEDTCNISATDLDFSIQTSNTFNPTTNHVFNSVIINKPAFLAAENIKQGIIIAGVSGTYAGLVPSGTINITDTGLTNVSAFEYAQITDNSLDARNIKAGTIILGLSGTFTGDATATSSDILYNKTAYVNGNLVVGDIQSKSAATYSVSTISRTITAGQYLSGDQEILGITTSNLLAENIASGVVVRVGDSEDSSRILEITGTHLGRKTEDTKTVTFTEDGQEVTANNPTTQTLSKVIINKPANLLSEHIAANVTIAGVSGTFTADADALAGEILKGKIAYVNGSRVEGTYEGLVPTGKINITDTSEVNVSSFAAAQVVDSNLISENIKRGINILGISGSYDGIIPSGIQNITTTDLTDVAAFAYARVIDNDLSAENIKLGASILGVIGTYAGIIPSGIANITTTNLTNVSTYEYAQVVDNNLSAGNIKAGVNILGISGTYSGIIPSGTISITSTDVTDVSAFQYAQIADLNNNLTAGNIKAGVSILGISGTYETPTQSASTTFAYDGQVVTGYHLSQITIYKPATLLAENIKDGVLIASVSGTFTANGALSAITGDTHNGTEILDDEIRTKDLLYDKIAYAQGKKYKGIYNVGAIQVNNTLTFSNNQTTINASAYNKDAATQVTIGVESPSVIFTGNGQVIIPSVDSKLLRQVTINAPNELAAENIRAGVTIAGITGSYNNQKPETTCIINATALNFEATASNIFTPEPDTVFNSVVVYKPDSLVASNIAKGTTIAHVLGTFTDDATATVYDIVPGKTAYVDGVKLTGSMPSLGSTTYFPISTSDQTISQGQYLSGTQTIKRVVYSNLVPANIAAGVTVTIGDPDHPDSIASVTGQAQGLKPEQTKTENLDFSTGDQIVVADSGKTMASVTILKPTNFESYIQDGARVGEVIGTYTSDGTLTGTGTGQTKLSSQLRSGIIAYSQGVRYEGNMSEQAAQTIVVSSSDQTILAGSYLTGAQTIKGVTHSNITASDILSGVTLEIGDAQDSDRILKVVGNAWTREQFFTYVNTLSYGVTS